MGRAWASSKLLIYYFVMAHSGICHCRLSSQGSYITWLHMHELSFTLKSWPKFLAFMSVIYAWLATWSNVHIKFVPWHLVGCYASHSSSFPQICVRSMAKCDAVIPLMAAMKRRGDAIHIAAETIKKMYDLNIPELVAQVSGRCLLPQCWYKWLCSKRDYEACAATWRTIIHTDTITWCFQKRLSYVL